MSDQPFAHNRNGWEVSLIASRLNAYPGETITFSSRIIREESAGAEMLVISLPDDVTVTNPITPEDVASPRLEVGQHTQYMVWDIYNLDAEQPYDFGFEATLGQTTYDFRLQGQASVITADNEVLAYEPIEINIQAKGDYLKYLPSIFEQDEFMGRFLMLFESFWSPIDNQIDSVHNYFDPRITPESFLPWLASWLDLELDDRWPIDKNRQLIRWAIALHRSRGTRWGLQKYLEIYTGQVAEITEQTSNNFILGESAILGPGVAFGKGNQPHTFVVSLRLPELVDIKSPVERKQAEAVRKRTIEAIIEMQKPAHTMYTLDLHVVPPDQLDVELEADENEDDFFEVVDEITAQAATWFTLDDDA